MSAERVNPIREKRTMNSCIWFKYVQIIYPPSFRNIWQPSRLCFAGLLAFFRGLHRPRSSAAEGNEHQALRSFPGKMRQHVCSLFVDLS